MDNNTKRIEDAYKRAKELNDDVIINGLKALGSEILEQTARYDRLMAEYRHLVTERG